jgi:hypothetical protein
MSLDNDQGYSKNVKDWTIRSQATLVTEGSETKVKISTDLTLVKSSNNQGFRRLCQNSDYFADFYANSNHRPIACHLQSTKRACRSERIDTH